MENLPYLVIAANGHKFFFLPNSTLEWLPDLPGFDSQGSVTFFHKLMLSQLALNPLSHSLVN